MKENKWLPPPWIAYPDLEQASLLWRLGTEPEGYLDQWAAWHERLSREEQEEYARLLPRPDSWLTAEEREKRALPAYTLKKVRDMYLDGAMPKLQLFWGHQPSKNGVLTRSCFSQWWKSDFFFGSQLFCCMEQAMMACKARLFDDEEALQKILACDNPAKMKKYGRQVRNFDAAVWDEHKYRCVCAGNYHKFAANVCLRNFLLSTGDDILVEASPYDRVWGIGLGMDDPRVSDPRQWNGENLLGFALMRARDEIRRVFENEGLCREPEKEWLRRISLYPSTLPRP